MKEGIYQKIKSCKGCVYLNSSIRKCTVFLSYERFYDELTEKYYFRQVNNIVELNVMRSKDGSCGEDRILYESCMKYNILGVFFVLGFFGFIVFLIYLITQMFGA